MATYTIDPITGAITNDACEINVVHHCNLSCRGCTHLSPLWRKQFIDVDALANDLRLLSRFYHVNRFRLLGGEPLLHPDIVSVIETVRMSGIAQAVAVATNGILLWKMPDAFWQAVDIINVSVYPDRRMSPEQLRICQQKAEKFDVWLYLHDMNEFREAYTELGTSNQALVKRIYDTCLYIHRQYCHNIEHGYFYKCPQAVFLPKLLKDKFSSPPIDGVKITDSSTLGEELRAYLASSDPLASCTYCLGSVGTKFVHQEVRRSEWRQFQHVHSEERIDFPLLEALEQDLDYQEVWGAGSYHKMYYVRSTEDYEKCLVGMYS